MIARLGRLAWITAALLLLAACGADEPGTPAADDAPADAAPPDGDAADPADDADELTVPDSPGSGVRDGQIIVGWMGDVTGPTASAQTPNLAGTEAYFAHVNAQGGVLGRQFRLLVEDDQFSGERIIANFHKLVDDDRVLAIVQMGQSEQFQDDVRAAEIPLVAPPQTTDLNLDNPYSFNVLAHYGDQADVAVARLAERVGGMDELVAVVVQLTVPSGDEWNAYVERRLQAEGATYAGRVTMDPGQPDATVLVAQLQRLVNEQGVNAVAFHGAPANALQLLSEMERVGLRVPVIGIHGLAGLSVYEEGPEGMLELVEALHSFLPVNVDSEGGREIAEFVAGTQWEDSARQPNFAHGWVAGMAVHQGIVRAAEQSGTLDRATFFEALQGPIETRGITCDIDWTDTNYTPCAAPFRWDGEGLVPVAPFVEWDEFLSGEYHVMD